MDLTNTDKKRKGKGRFGLIVAIEVILLLALCVFLLRDKILPGWHEDKGGVYHISLIGRDKGLKKIGGEYYLFSYSGELLYGFNRYGGFTYYSDEKGRIVRTEYTVDGETYNFDGEDGRLITGVNIIDGKLYYFDDHGFKIFGVVEIDGKRYSFNSKGALDYGLTTVDGKTYYFDEKSGEAQTGEQVVGGETYYFGEDGVLASGRYSKDGYCWFFGTDGSKLFGWQMDKESGISSYYFPSGMPAKGFENIDGEYYYFAENGRHLDYILYEDGFGIFIKDGKPFTGWLEDGDVIRYFDENGRMVTSDFAKKGNDTYYFDAEGFPVRGWLERGEKEFYFLEDGKMAVGDTVIDGETYHFGDDGALVR